MKILADVERTRREFNNRHIVVIEQGSLVLHEGQLFFVKDMRTKDIVNDELDFTTSRMAMFMTKLMKMMGITIGQG